MSDLVANDAWLNVIIEREDTSQPDHCLCGRCWPDSECAGASAEV